MIRNLFVIFLISLLFISGAAAAPKKPKAGCQSWLQKHLAKNKALKDSRQQNAEWEQMANNLNLYLASGHFQKVFTNLRKMGINLAEEGEELREQKTGFSASHGYPPKIINAFANIQFRKLLKREANTFVLAEIANNPVTLGQFLNTYFDLYKKLPLDPKESINAEIVPFVHDLLINRGKRTPLNLNAEVENTFETTQNFGGFAFTPLPVDDSAPVVSKASDSLKGVRVTLENLSLQFISQYKENGIELNRSELEPAYINALTYNLFRQKLPDDLRLAVEGMIEEDPFLLARLVRVLFHHEHRLPLSTEPLERFANFALEKWLFHRAFAPQQFSKSLNKLLEKTYPERTLISESEVAIQEEKLEAEEANTDIPQFIAHDWNSFNNDLLAAKNQGSEVILYSKEGVFFHGSIKNIDEKTLQLTKNGTDYTIIKDEINPISLVILEKNQPTKNSNEENLAGPVSTSRFDVKLSSTVKSLLTKILAKERLPEWENRIDEIEKKILKTINLLRENPNHPGLNSKDISEAVGLYRGYRVFQSYLENNRPGAGRVYWFFGPERRQISVLSIVQHPINSSDYLSTISMREQLE